MHRQTLVALSWCLVLGAAMAVLWEVHRSHGAPPPAPLTLVEAATPPPRGLPEPAADSAAAPALDTSPDPQPAASLQYAGNTNTRKLHRRGCRHFSCTNCTAKFSTREEALAAGYSPCGICDP